MKQSVDKLGIICRAQTGFLLKNLILENLIECIFILAEYHSIYSHLENTFLIGILISTAISISLIIASYANARLLLSVQCFYMLTSMARHAGSMAGWIPKYYFKEYWQDVLYLSFDLLGLNAFIILIWKGGLDCY
jgi:hypothetical protein